MDKDQVAQRRHRHPDRQRQADDGDQCVGNQVADHRQQAQQEGQHDQGLGQRQLDPEQRQDQRQEDPGEEGVEQGDLDLGEDDVAKRLDQQVQTVEQRRRQRLTLGQVGDPLQGNDRPQDHADQQGHEHVRRVLAYQLQLAQVLAGPGADGGLELGGAGRQVGIQERRQLAPGLVHHHHELAQRGTRVLRLMQQEADGPGEQQGQQADHQGAQQGHRQPARTPAFDQPLQLRGEHVDQLEHQQPGQQAGQQTQGQGQQQATEDDDPTDEQQMTL